MSLIGLRRVMAAKGMVTNKFKMIEDLRIKTITTANMKTPLMTPKISTDKDSQHRGQVGHHRKKFTRAVFLLRLKIGMTVEDPLLTIEIVTLRELSLKKNKTTHVREIQFMTKGVLSTLNNYI